MRELASEGTVDHVKDQHVISKAILRRFTVGDGRHKDLLYPFRLRYPDVRHTPLGPDGCGKVPNFVAYASGSVERLWKQTEDKMHDALAAVDDGTLFGSPAHVATIKDAIALHYTRSIAVQLMHFRIWAQVCAVSRTRWLTSWRPLLEAEFYRSKGFYAVGNQALERFLDEVMQPSMDMAASGQLFRVGIEDLFRQARAFARGTALEILESGSGEFLLGDVPALTLRRDRAQVGALGGIALGDANAVIMPLGPRHLASLGKQDVAVEVSSDQVADLNARQVAGAVEYVYLRPGSGLEHFVKSIIQDSPR